MHLMGITVNDEPLALAGVRSGALRRPSWFESASGCGSVFRFLIGSGFEDQRFSRLRSVAR
jgi:hypothetical protein